MNYLISIVGGLVFTEFVGYWLHILLHSEKIAVLSRSHMIHHLRDYGPRKPLHRKEYLSSADNRASLFGFGFEWMAPILLIISISLALLYAFNISWQCQLAFIGTGLFWGYVLFGYMHGAMHLTNFWMMKIPFIKKWFLSIRRLHDFHHLQITEDGRMLANYGICFFWFDRLFGTFSPQNKSFNENGHQAALIRYKDVLK